MARAITVLDLGFGDAGKGTIVDALTRKTGARLVVRYSGGPQCAHNVLTDRGVHHTFAQYGSGALAGAQTLLTKDVLVDPLRLVSERAVLAPKTSYDRRVLRPYIHEDCLVVTPFHGALNRLRELSRGLGRHGSCGIGVGETVRYAIEEKTLRGGQPLTMGLLEQHKGETALWRTQQDMAPQAAALWEDIEPEFRTPEAARDLSLFTNEWAVGGMLRRYDEVMEGFQCVSESDTLHLISSQDTIWEGAQGVLLDEDYGFHPYTTWSRVTLRNATETLAAAGVTDVTNIGVLRTYGCRHGAGPFPSEDGEVGKLVAEQHNAYSPWQHRFRTGWFDMVLARYALTVASGTQKAIHWMKTPIHQLALTHLDVLDKRMNWPIVMGYPLELEGNIPSPEDFSKRERLTSALMDVGDWNRVCTTVAAGLVPQFISQQLGLPRAISSFGPKTGDKIFHLSA